MESVSPSWKAMLLAAAIFAAEVDYVGSSSSSFVTTCDDGHKVAISKSDGWMRINPSFVILPASPPSVQHYNSRFKTTRFNDVRDGQLRSTNNEVVMMSTTSLFASSSDDNSFLYSDYDNNLNYLHELNSEEDAIRVLRTSPRQNNNKACHTAFDVLYLMSQYSITTLSTCTEDFTPSSISNLSRDELSSIIETIVDNVSPNIGAAALRRLASPPFLPITFQVTNKYRKQEQVNKRISTIEQNVYDQLMHQLLNKMSYTMKSQMSVMSSTTSTKSQYDDPKLLPHFETLIIPPTSSTNKSESSVLNWYALADLLYSLSNLTNVLVNHDERNNIIKGHLLTSISPTEQNSITLLFQNVIEYLSWDDRITSSFVRCIGSRRIIRDVLQPIFGMQNVQRKMYYQQSDMEEGHVYTTDVETFTSQSNSSCDYTHLMTILSSYLVLPHSLEKLSAYDLSQILWYMTKLYHPYEQQFTTTMTIQYSQRNLLKVFMRRLRKYPIRASASGETLVHVIRSVSHLIGYLEKQDEEILLKARQSLDEAVLPSLSIRLPGEDENDTTLFPLSIEEEREGIASSTQQPPQTNNDKSIEIPTKILHEEAVTMFYTLINEIVHPPFYSRDNKKSNNKYHGANEEKVKLHSLSLRQIGDILVSVNALRIPHEDITTVVVKILELLTTSQNNFLSQCHSCKDISRVLLSLQRLRVGSGVYNDAINSIESCDNDKNDDMKQLSAHTTNNEIESHSVQLLGERFLEIVRLRKEQSKWACTTKTLTIILRSGVLMFPGNSTATEAILDAATVLILDEMNNVDVDYDNSVMSSFLSSCNEFEVSNYLFAFAMAKRFNEDVFIALIDQMMDDDIIESCAPRSASRALWSCAMLLSLDDVVGNANRKHEFALKQVDLFHQLSPKLLLTSSLSPTDISSAMWAMGKAEYAIDQGIFDQLSESLASDDMLTRSSTRLVSQALWACGAMVQFEDFTSLTEISDSQEREDVGIESIDDDEASNVPYLKSADRYLRFLIANEEHMTPKHISQSIWAMGRLRLSNFILIEQMADIALRLSASLNAREIANIVWGLSKLEFNKKSEVISKLVDCLISSPKLRKQCNAMEASTILFVLGKLKIRDEEAFSVLSNILKGQLTEASTQSITNSLWAHSVVSIPPPPELLGLWAQDRLNLLTVSSTTIAEGK